MNKCAVFSCEGLGDGIISMYLSFQLHLNGFEVDSFHDRALKELSSWYPHLLIKNFPSLESIDDIFQNYDRVFIAYSDSSAFLKELIDHGKKYYAEKTTVLNPCVSHTQNNHPFYQDTDFSKDRCLVDNIYDFCENRINLLFVTKESGIIPPKGLKYQKFSKRVVIHPTSSKKGKQWGVKRFKKLGFRLIKKGYTVSFIVNLSEREEWQDVIALKVFDFPLFNNLGDLAAYLYESKVFIGSDSGLGHLASAVGIPTISLFRGKRFASLWRPGWSRGKVIYPSIFIPNVKFYRLRDKYWKWFIRPRNIMHYVEHYAD